MKRECDECSTCCQGWLYGSVNGHSFYPGKPCHFYDKKCTIYEKRPQEPCRRYECAWLIDENIPIWMKPNLSKVIISKKEKNNIHYYDIAEAGEKIKSEILNWIIQWALNNQYNIRYQIMGGINYIGSKEFVESISKDVLIPEPI